MENKPNGSKSGLSRRDFVKASAAVSVGAVLPMKRAFTVQSCLLISVPMS